MFEYRHHIALAVFLVLLSNYSLADVVDPEKHILKNGHHSEKMGDDGKTRFFTFTERAPSVRIRELESEIEKLPKHIDIFKMCDLMRGGVKAKLLEQRGIIFDVAVTNYGYSGSTVACTLKYMHESSVGSQLIYTKKGVDGMYMVFITD